MYSSKLSVWIKPCLRRLDSLLAPGGVALALLSPLPASAQPHVEARLADEVFQLELVADPASRRQGLMGRTELATNGGMLFDFPDGTTPTIWMRNMQISLDLLFVDQQARLRQVFKQVPPCKDLPCDLYSAEQPLRFVIEVPAGTADRLGLQPGDQLDLGGHQLSSVPAF